MSIQVTVKISSCMCMYVHVCVCVGGGGNYRGRLVLYPVSPEADIRVIVITLFILYTDKQVLWQTVQPQIKCHIRWHFIRVCTVC